jgi:phosphohistidine phosphatase SixA
MLRRDVATAGTDPMTFVRSTLWAGHRQQGSLPGSATPVAQILSSPSVRCVETVQPLAAHCGLAVQVTDVLSPSGALESALDLVRTVPDHGVLCSHGELIPQVMEVLTRQGATLVGPADWRKGSTWVLERDGGRVVRTYAEPAVRQLGVVGR